MLVVSHNLTDVFRVADRIAVLYLGQLAAVGPAVRLRHAVHRRADDHGPIRPGGNGNGSASAVSARDSGTEG